MAANIVKLPELLRKSVSAEIEFGAGISPAWGFDAMHEYPVCTENPKPY
jgi:hypothetical protein